MPISLFIPVHFLQNLSYGPLDSPKGAIGDIFCYAVSGPLHKLLRMADPEGGMYANCKTNR